MKLEKPKAPPRGFKEFCETYYFLAIGSDKFDYKTTFPCKECHCRGYTKVAVSPYDTEENECRICRGAGSVNKENFLDYYYKAHLNYKNKLEEYKKIKTILGRAAAKLNKEEIEVVKRYAEML